MRAMDTLQPLSHHFLIAMPGLQGDFFSRSLIYLCDHSADGAMGLVVNKPLQINLDELLQHFELEGNRGQGQPVLDRKSTRLNSSHVAISYAVFCLKKKNDRTNTCIRHITFSNKYELRA